MSRASEQRFSSRVDDYRQYRPEYPAGIVSTMNKKGMNEESIIADVGSGTGIFTKLILPKVRRVYAVEPNPEMRRVAEKDLGKFTQFASLSAGAERIPLPDSSVDFITTAQAFHWFDLLQTKKEFSRILKREGCVFVIWNQRKLDSDFMESYEKLLRSELGERYTGVHHCRITQDSLSEFFTGRLEHEEFENHQELNLEEFLGRVFSSSYTPEEHESCYHSFRRRLVALFNAFREGDLVRFAYRTTVHIGSFTL